MLKPKGLLQEVALFLNTARTLAYNEYGEPVIQGKVSVIDATGLFSVSVGVEQAVLAERVARRGSSR